MATGGFAVEADGVENLGIGDVGRPRGVQAVGDRGLAPSCDPPCLAGVLSAELVELGEQHRSGSHGSGGSADICGNDRSHRPETALRQGCGDRIAVACASAEKDDPILRHEG